MHVKVITSKGVPRLYIYETYYDKDPATGKKRIRSKMIESLGRLDELKKLYDDPVAHFKEVCQLRTSDQKQAQTLNLQIDLTSRIGLREDNLKNVGYGIFKELYKQLELDRFWNWKTRDLSIDYSVDQIFRLLVFSRILYPGSKKKAFDRRSVFFEPLKGFPRLTSTTRPPPLPPPPPPSRNGSLTIRRSFANGTFLLPISTVRIITLILDVLMLTCWMRMADR